MRSPSSSLRRASQALLATTILVACSGGTTTGSAVGGAAGGADGGDETEVRDAGGSGGDASAPPKVRMTNLEIAFQKYPSCPDGQSSCGYYEASFVVESGASRATVKLERIAFAAGSLRGSTRIDCDDAPFLIEPDAMSEIIHVKFNTGNQPGLQLETQPHFTVTCGGSPSQSLSDPSSVGAAPESGDATLSLTFRLADNSTSVASASAPIAGR